MVFFRILSAVSLIIVLIWAAGCSSVISTTNLGGSGLSETGVQPVAHIHSDIWGIYFLGFESCPVITGSARHPGSYHFFRNIATTNSAAEMVLEESRKLGADAVIDLKTDWESNWQPYTLIFWLKEAQASGNAVILEAEGEARPPDFPGEEDAGREEPSEPPAE